MPRDFNPDIQDSGNHYWWGEKLEVAGETMTVELGFSKAGGKANIPAEMRHLREGAWQLKELARIGRRDLMQYADIGRHRNRVNRAAKMQ